jgi:putative heme transporter
MTLMTNQDEQQSLWRAGRTAWAILGLIVIVGLAGYLASLLAMIAIPVVLALFPATLLVPVANWLQRLGALAVVAALLTILVGMLLLLGTIGGMIALLVAQVPDLVQSATEGIAELEQLLERIPLGVNGVYNLLEMAQEQLGEVGDLVPRAMRATMTAFETLASLLLLLVVLFFYLKDGRRLADGIIAIAPRRYQSQLADIAEMSWDMLGSYFRGQLLVALVDAVCIGLGLLFLGVPVALPLAVLIFFGGLFPIIGAVATGIFAVLVAVADGGLMAGLTVLGLVLLVQQLEGNVLEPLILGRIIPLHPLIIILSITGAALLFGVLGAFLAVPVVGITAQILEYLNSDEHEAGEEDNADEKYSVDEEYGASKRRTSY